MIDRNYGQKWIIYLMPGENGFYVGYQNSWKGVLLSEQSD